MNITVIIPIHEYNEVVEGYLEKAIESIKKQENGLIPQILIVCPPNLNIKTFDNVNVLINEDNTSYQSQVNFAVNKISTDYFTVLEYDDEFSTTYFSNAVKHIDSYPMIDIFLSMMIEVNEINQGIKITNETVWAQQFVGENGEMGYLNLNSLKQYSDFKLSGAIIKKNEFINLGMYKNNIKLSFMYEFLLRALNNGCKIYTIPKIGYKHLAVRENSLFDIYSKTMSISERKFWFETALNESNFTTDRVIDLTRLNTRE